MTIRKFDEQTLLKVLGSLSVELRVAFATACAQRQLPNYVRFATRRQTDATILTSVLAQLWNAVEGKAVRKELEKLLDECMSLIPADSERPDEAQAEDAVASAAYAIRTLLTGDSQEAAWSAQRAFDAVFRHVVSRLNPGVHDKSIMDRVSRDPLVQIELERQYLDLAELSGASADNHRAAIAIIRSRAEQEPMDLR